MASPFDTGRALGARYLPALQSLEYRKLWSASLCSQSSAWALILARAALVFEITGSAAWTGYVTFAAMIPSVLVSPLAGFLADRFDRRTVLAYAYVVNLSHNLLLAILVAWLGVERMEAWWILLLAVVNGSSRTTQMPSAQALLANTIPRERLFNGVALFQVTQQGSPVRRPIPDPGGALDYRPSGVGVLCLRGPVRRWAEPGPDHQDLL